MDEKQKSVADYVFGIPLVLAGAFAIFLDVFTIILKWTTGRPSLWVAPIGTLLGTIPLLVGAYLAFRNRKTVNQAGDVMAAADPMTKDEFYRTKRVVAVEWWLGPSSVPPNTLWARLREFDDGTADACWENGGVLYGFDNRKYAGYFLSEDEYSRFARGVIGDEFSTTTGDTVEESRIPHWPDRDEQGFRYLGTY